MSQRKFSDRKDVLTYRQHFAAVWQRFVTENFQSPAHVAHVFKVDPSTAENWWHGVNAPSGWALGIALRNRETRDAALHLIAGDA